MNELFEAEREKKRRISGVNYALRNLDPEVVRRYPKIIGLVADVSDSVGRHLLESWIKSLKNKKPVSGIIYRFL